MKKYIMIAALASFLLSACGFINESGFPDVAEPYNPEQAAQNGDVVNVHGKYSNLDKWEKFLNNVSDGQEDQVRITQYTIEGDPIFYELIFDGQTIQYTYDNSLDAYGSDRGRPHTGCSGIGTMKNEDGQEYYVLNGCENDTGDTFWFPTAD